MINCPCCSHQMVRPIRAYQTYWLCRHCWQALPLDSDTKSGSNTRLSLLLKETRGLDKRIWYDNVNESIDFGL